MMLIAGGLIDCAFATLLFAAAIPLGKLLLGGLGPQTLAGLLYCGAALSAAPAAYRSGRPKLSARDLRRLVAIVLAGGLAGPVLLMWALQRSQAASVALWLNLEAIATALLAWWFFDENLDWRAWLAVGLIALAGGILAGPSSGTGLLAPILVSAACLCWGLDNNLTALVETLVPSQITLLKGLVGGGFNLAIGIILEPHAITFDYALAALLAGIISYGLSLMLYIRGARLLGAVRAQAVFASAPFAAALLAWALLDERVATRQLGAGLLMAAGIALMYSRHEHVHRHEPQSHTHRHRHDDPHHAHLHAQSVAGAHTHEPTHEVMLHAHRHLPDLHHRHQH